MDSVTLGARETTRRTGTGIRTARPVSSETVRKDSCGAVARPGPAFVTTAAASVAHKTRDAAFMPRKVSVGKRSFKIERSDSLSATGLQTKMAREFRAKQRNSL